MIVAPMAPTPLPFNQEAEAALLARLVLDPRQIPLVQTKLQPADFYVQDHQRIFEAMVALSQEHRPVDVTTLGAEIGDRTLVSDLAMTAGPGHHAPLEEYARVISDEAFRRRVIGSLDNVIRRAYAEEDRGDLLANLQDAVSQVMRGLGDERLISPLEAIDLYQEVLRERAEGKGTGLEYGIHSLDEIIQPAQGGDMIVIAARPSVGKTALAEMIADRWAAARPPVLFASLEMSLSQLLDRAVSRTADLNANKLMRGTLGAEAQRLAAEAAEARRGVGIWYLDDPFATTNDLRVSAAKTKLLAGGIGAIVVDYLQLLKDAGEQEVQRVTKISRNLKAIAREFDVPLLVLSQLSRAVEARDDKHPKLHDLRESGAIEQDADVVIGLMRELGTYQLDLEVLKNRFGPLTQISLMFDPTRVTFEEA